MRLINRFVDISTRPIPLRTLLMRRLLTRWPMGSYPVRLNAGAVNRPWYGLCLYQAALEAKALGYAAITAVELGVAGGNGLLCLCDHRDEIKKVIGIDIHVLGFDTGTGLPATDDPRDVRYYWSPGSYPMDRPALERRLAGRAELVFGDVSKTVPMWQPNSDAPLGAVLFDLDLYSSTASALGLLTKENVLPRVWCYFDDLAGSPANCFADGTGEREAIREFNASPERKRMNDTLSPAHVFKFVPPEFWHRHIYLYHRFAHPRYNDCIAPEKHQLSLTAG